MDETIFLNKMRYQRASAARVDALRDELLAWLMNRPDTSAQEVLRALAHATQVMVHLPVGGETRAVRKRLDRWGKAAYTFGRCDI